MKAKNRLTFFGIVLAFLLVLSNLDATAQVTSTQSGNWSDGTTWVGGVAPTATDDAVIASGHTVTVTNTSSTPARCYDLTVNSGGILQPDVGTRYIGVDGSFGVDAGGLVNYSNGTGRLNWTFYGIDGNNTIINDNGTGAKAFDVMLAMYDVVIAGTMVTPDGNADNFYVYGNFTVNGLGDWNSGTGTIIYFDNTAQKTLSNSSACEFENLTVVDGASIAVSSEFTVTDDLIIESTGAMAITTAAGIVTISDGSGAGQITATGTLTFGSGTELIVGGTTTLLSSMTGFDGTFTVNNDLDVGAFSISGTGDFNLSTGQVLTLNNANGVDGAIDLTGTRVFSTGASYVFEGGTTGFADAGVTSLSNMTVTAATTSTESWSMTGALDVTGGSLIQTSGTVTMDGTTAVGLNASGGTMTLNNLVIANTALTITLGGDITLTGSFTQSGTGGTFTMSGNDIIFTGTGTITNSAGTLTVPAGSNLTINDAAASIALGSNIALGAGGNITLTTGTLDCVTYTITGTATPKLTLTAGTVRISNTGGLAGTLTGYLLNELTATSAINWEFYGVNTQTTLGLDLGAAIVGTGSTTANLVNAVTDLTITGGATAALSPAIVSLGATYAGTMQVISDFSVTGASVVTLPYHAVNNLLQMGSGATTNSMTFASTSSVQLNGLDINGTVTTSSDYTIAGFLTRTAGTFVNTNNIVTYTPGASMDSPDGTGFTFNNLNKTGANNLAPTTGATMTITGDLIVDDAGTFNFAAATNTVTFGGTSTLYRTDDGGAVTFYDMNVSTGNSLTASAAGLTTTVNGIDLNTSLAADINIATAATVTIVGTFTGNTGTSFDFAGTATLAGGGTKTFYDVTYAGNIACGVDLTIANDLTRSGGVWTQSAGTMTMTGTAATITTDAAASLDFNTGAMSISSGAIVTLTNGFTVTGGGSATVTSGGQLNIAATNSVTGTGTLTLASGATFSTTDAGGVAGSVNSTTISVDAETNYIFTGAAAALGFTGGATTGTGEDGGGNINAIANLTLDNPAATFAFAETFAMTGDLTKNGALVTAAATSGTVTLSGAASTISSGAGAGILRLYNLAIAATATAAQLTTDLTLDGTGGDAIAVAALGSLTQTTGTVTLNGADADITVTATGTLDLNNLTLAATAVATDVLGLMTIGGTLDVDALALFDASAGSTITFDGAAGSITVGAADNRILFDDLTITGTVTQTGNQIVRVEDALTVTSAGSFISGTGTIAFNGATASIVNSGVLTLNNLTFNAGATGATSSSDFTVAGDFTMGNAASVFTATSNTITLSGTANLTTLADNNQTFDNLTITGTITQVGDFVVDISGDMDVSGSFDANDLGTINFIDGTSKTLTNTGTLTFSKLSVASTASNILSTSSNFTISDQLIVGALGQFDASGGGTVTFTDAVGTNPDISLATTTASAVIFNSMAISTATITSTDDRDFQIFGDISSTGTGTFEFGLTGTTTKVWFVGSNQQTITNSSTGHIHFFNATLNNTNGLLLAGDAAIDEVKIFGTLRLQNGDIDLNGNNILTINNSATAKLSETPGNTVLNSGPSTSTGNVTIVAYTPGATLTNYNIGGLGAKLTTALDPGATTVQRYHIAREPGSSTGITRYYSITTANGSLNSTLTMLYDDTEIGLLTEADLQLLYADAAAGPWIYESGFSKDATNNLFRKTGIDEYTGEQEWWTAGVPSIITTTQLTKGVETSPLTAGRDDMAIYGLQFTSSAGTVDVTDLQIDLTALATPTQFSGYRLWSSTDNDFSTTSDNTEITIDTETGGAAADNYVAFDIASNALTVTPGVPLNIFLTVNVASTVISTTGAITPSFVHGDLAINNGVMGTSSETGTPFSFRAGMMFDENPNGISTSPLVAGAEDIAILGFRASATANASLMTNFDVIFSSSPSGVYSNYRLFRSNDNLYTAGSETAITMTPTVSGTTVSFDFTADAQGLNAGSYKYYYIVVDVDGSVNGANTAMTATISHSTVVGSNAGPRYMETDGTTAATTITGFTYSFETSTATVSSSNVAAGNLGKNVRNQPIYGFAITPDNSNTVAFTGVTAHVTFGGGASASDFTNYKLWYDANENDYPDAAESIATGTYTASTAKGNLTFSTFSSAQSFSSARNYLITANVSNSATTDGTISMQIYDQNYVTLTSPASVNTTNAPFTGNTMTVKAVGSPDHLAIVGSYSSAITTGGTVDMAIQVQDANNIPVNATSNISVVLTNSGTSVLTTGTGTITSGTNFVTVSPTLTLAAGTLTETITATDGAALLTSSSASNNIIVRPAAPAVGAETVTLGSATSTSFVISAVVNGNGSRRIIVVRADLPPDSPVDGVAYTAASNIENAGDVGTGQTAAGSFVVYDGSGVVSSTTVQGLVAGQKYYVMVFNYDGTGTLINYVTTATTINPMSITTSAGSADPYGSHQTAATAASILTDVDVSGAIAAADESDYFVFSVPTGKNHLKIDLSSLPANYELELYDATLGTTSTTMVLMRASASTGTTSETIIFNDATVSGPYILRIYGTDSDAYSATAYNVKVNTSATPFLSAN